MNAWIKIKQAVMKSTRVLVTTHHTPDPDAVGSALAMALWLKSLGKKVRVVNEDAISPWLQALPKTTMMEERKDIKSYTHDLVVVLDCGDFKRIGQVEEILAKGVPIINIDHHTGNPAFGTINIVEPTASSSCELVAQGLTALGVTITKDMATLLYAGMMTDTGSFRYDCTTPQSLRFAAQFIAQGVNPSVIYNQMYPLISSSDIRPFIELIHSAQLLCDGQLYYVGLTHRELVKFSKEFDWKERLLGFLRTVKGVKVVMLLSPLKDGRIRVNLRSQSSIDVAEICRKIDGGGHPKAAGATLDMPLAKAKSMMMALIKEEIC